MMTGGHELVGSLSLHDIAAVLTLAIMKTVAKDRKKQILDPLARNSILE